jgi:hypothetical protein
MPPPRKKVHLEPQESTAATAAGSGEYDDPRAAERRAAERRAAERRAAELRKVEKRYSADKGFQEFSDLINSDPTELGAEKFRALLTTNPELAFTQKVLFNTHTIGEPLQLRSPMWILVLARNFQYIEIMLDAAKKLSSPSAGDHPDDSGLYSKQEFSRLVNAVDDYNGETPLWTAVHDAITFKEKLGMGKESNESILVAKVLLRHLASPGYDARDKHPDESTPLQLIHGYETRYEANHGPNTFEGLDGGKWHKLEAAMSAIFNHVHAPPSPIPRATMDYLRELY